MIRKPYPGVFNILVPLEGNPLGYTNTYLLKANKGCALIDFGWNGKKSFHALSRGIQAAGVNFKDITWLISTHSHFDHYGLAGRLQKLTHAPLVIHERECQYLQALFVNEQESQLYKENWLQACGIPEDAHEVFYDALRMPKELISDAHPDCYVYGGEMIDLGSFKLELLWTPGHAPGHICAMDSERRILFSGDHILEEISPNVGVNMDMRGNPLADYFDSLKRMEELEVDLVLPGHGRPFESLQERSQGIADHHKLRLQEIVSLCAESPKTIYEAAKRTTWFADWNDLDLVNRIAAITETFAHIKFLLSQGVVEKGEAAQSGFHYAAIRQDVGF